MTDRSPESYGTLERKLEAREAELAEERAYRTAISDVLRVISESPSDLQPVFDAITERAMTLCGAHIGAVTRFDGKLIHLMAYHGVTSAAEQEMRAVFPMSPGRGMIVARAVLDRAPFQNADVLNDPDHVGKEAARQAGIRAGLAVPMLIDGNCVGTISVNRAAPGLFPDKQIKLLQTFADQAVIAIENVRLFSETQEALEHETATAEILRVISSSPTDVQPVFEAIAERALTICNAQLAVTTRVEGKVEHLMAMRGFTRKERDATRAAYPMNLEQAGITSRAVVARAAVQIPDVAADSGYEKEFKDTLLQLGARSRMAVPMLRDGEVLGAIAVGSSELGPYPDKLVSLLETFADQAVIAIENVRLFNETQEALEQQTAISDILRVISESPTDVQPVFDAITERAMALCDAKIGAAMRFDGEQIHVANAHGFSPAADDAIRDAFPMKPERSSVSGRAVLECAPVEIPDLLMEEEYSLQPVAQESRSVVAVPLMREGQVLGVITIGRAAPGSFPRKQLKLLQTFADQAVIAIENVRLFNETQEALEQQTASSEILRVISESPSDVQPVFDAIGERAMALCEADLGVATRFDGEWIHLSTLYGPSQETIEVIRAAFPVKAGRDSLSGRVVVERAPVQIADMLGDSEYAVQAAAMEAGSALGVPLIREGQVVGALMVARKETGSFPEKQISLLQTFADQAVIAIENVRLFKETQEALERQTATADILRVISNSPTDVQPVFDAIAKRALALCNAQWAITTRYDGELIHLMSSVHGPDMPEEAVQTLQAAFPMKPGLGTMNARAIQNRATVQTEDYRNDPNYVAAAKDAMYQSGMNTLLAVPMLREYEIINSIPEAIGSISVSRTQSGPFPQKHVSLLETFADQAVIAIENVRLFNETQEALERQTAISDILRVTTESPTDVQPVLEALADHAVRLCDSAVASIFLTEGDNLRHVVSRGEGAVQALEANLIPIDRTSTSGRAIVDRQTVHVEDMQAELEEFPRGHELAHSMGHRTIVVAPLLREGQPFGTIMLRRMEVRPFGARDLALLRTFGDQAAIALENVRLFNETKAALDRQTATAEVLRVISSSIEDTAPVFEAILDSCRHLFNSEEIMILLERDDGQVTPGAYRSQLAVDVRRTLDLTEGREPIYPLPVGDSVHGLAVRAGRAVYFPSVADAAGISADMQAVLDNSGDHSLIAAPMMREGRGIGTLIVGQFPPRPFSDKEIALLTTFADQAVIAIENARLFNETKEALERQTASADILKVISSSPTDLQPVFDAIADHALALCNGDFASVALFDGEFIDVVVLRGLTAEQERAARALSPMKPDSSIISARAIMNRAPVQVSDLQNDPEFIPVAPIRDAGLRSGIAVPMLKEGRCLGSIAVLRKGTGNFPGKLVELFQTFADQAVIAIENARLFNETKEALEQQTATAEVLRVISGSVADTAPVFDKILDSCERLFATEEIAILLVGADGLAHIGGLRGRVAEHARNLFPMPLERTLLGVAISERRVVHIPDASEFVDLPPIVRDLYERAGNLSCIVAPMLWEGRGIGSLTLIRQPPKAFSDKEITLLTTFADQAVIAIENARLFHEIEDKSHELEVANQHKSEFLANMSHELRTPLNAIIGFSEVLIERMFGDLNEKQDDYLKDIYNSGKHLLALINDILDLSKIEAGRMELDVETFDVAAALENTLTLIRERAQQHGIALELDIARDVGELRADQRKLKQIMLNLLSNAVKFTPDGGRIDVRARLVDDALEVSVSDTGIGIAESDQEKIFQEFQQVGGDYTNKGEGTGLGLALTKRFVELHGGTLSLVSEPERGSTFIFTLPGQP